MTPVITYQTKADAKHARAGFVDKKRMLQAQMAVVAPDVRLAMKKDMAEIDALIVSANDQLAKFRQEPSPASPNSANSRRKRREAKIDRILQLVEAIAACLGVESETEAEVVR